MVVENAFGILKMKFPRVQSKLMTQRWSKAVLIVLSCLQLHNLIQRLEHPEIDLADYQPVDLPVEPKARRDAIADIISS